MQNEWSVGQRRQFKKGSSHGLSCHVMWTLKSHESYCRSAGKKDRCNKLVYVCLNSNTTSEFLLWLWKREVLRRCDFGLQVNSVSDFTISSSRAVCHHRRHLQELILGSFSIRLIIYQPPQEPESQQKDLKMIQRGFCQPGEQFVMGRDRLSTWLKRRGKCFRIFF